MISVWNASAAHALREAMRMSIDDFASHLEVSRRGVASWGKRGEARLRWDVQRKLDEALAAAPAAVRRRLAATLSAQQQPAPTSAAGSPRWPLTEQLTAAAEDDAAGLALLIGEQTTTAAAGVAPMVATLGELLVPPPQARGARPPALIHLELQVARARMAYQEARYRAVAGELATLAQALAEARADGQARFPHRIRRLAAAVHQITAGLLVKLGELPLAMLAAERSASEAEASGDPLVIAASARCTAQALHHSGHHERALAYARQAAAQLAATVGLDGPRPMSAYGALLLSGAVAAAHAADRAAAAALLTDAARAAKTLGAERNFGWTAFGASNVSLHRLDVLLQLAEPAAALQVSAAIDPTAIFLPERLAAYHVGSARALQAIAQPAAAVGALKKAYRVAPEEVRMRPDTRLLATELAAATRGPAKAQAARFAELVLRP
ncbi:hypothetical protein Rhe02_43640 [Rhizocola hellebori]|uniref:XRE family transcriptional regulator n=1 Tax=Rhizocola hellebori TaxID=1392758 RepID=A0A8J3VHI3_9ACTN|nr:hypothetical protein [Rhizocola hellebori]GIH06297.1 hypothetical protein Rhe02_43640 [Rhizocola hellebori]